MSAPLTAGQVIRLLGLVPLEGEGGMHRQTYASPRALDGAPAGTAIYYLLTANSFSHLHRLTGDEVYHFYLGDPVELCELLPDGTGRVTILGQDLAAGQAVQHTVEAGVWQGSRLAPGGAWALLGTTMCPGYTPACYTHGCRQELLARYPAYAAQIAALTGETCAQ